MFIDNLHDCVRVLENGIGVKVVFLIESSNEFKGKPLKIAEFAYLYPVEWVDNNSEFSGLYSSTVLPFKQDKNKVFTLSSVIIPISPSSKYITLLV